MEVASWSIWLVVESPNRGVAKSVLANLFNRGPWFGVGQARVSFVSLFLHL